MPTQSNQTTCMIWKCIDGIDCYGTTIYYAKSYRSIVAASIGSGSCIMPKKVKIVRVAKPDGKILEFGTPIHVKDILTNYPAYGVGVSKKVTEPLSADHELKSGRMYYLLPSLRSPPNLASLRSAETDGGIKRIKVIITKQQLERLVNKQISVEDILSEVQTFGVKFLDNRKPKLDSIPEENE
ncbi:uncharacterized protein HKW66_Vig0105360 [Vigna angularis]|uniref:Uncharacterized protein n=1 Tax=Phaseolus angularis TaxID=3914 RepID=A0A8T0KJG7_PHAAN|nr:uncharacterized protein HKW66_Vig0105360 [Vigna angularis]